MYGVRQMKVCMTNQEICIHGAKPIQLHEQRWFENSIIPVGVIVNQCYGCAAVEVRVLIGTRIYMTGWLLSRAS